MTRVSVNPTPERLRSAFIDLLFDYAGEKGLVSVPAAGRRRRVPARRPGPRRASSSGGSKLPAPDVIWMDGTKAAWNLYVMPARSKLKRLLSRLNDAEHAIVAVDSLGNIGVIEPIQLLHFIERSSVLIEAEKIRSLSKDISSILSPRAEFHFKGTIDKNHQFVKDYFSLRIRAGLVPRPMPGQFLQVMCDSEPHARSQRYRSHAMAEGRWPNLCGTELLEHRPFLRRPFSIASYGPSSKNGGLRATSRLGSDWLRLIQWAESELEIIYMRQPGGAGTGALARRKVGDEIDVVGPLGKGFTIAPLPKVAILVGGGIGAPPLLFLAEELVRRGVEVKVFLGALTRSRIPFQLRGATHPRVPRFERLGISPIICTDDGSAGRRGLVTQPVSQYLEKECETIADNRVFACGPRPMLAALQGIASRCDVPCEALLEEKMACGFGACISCVCAVKESGQKAAFTRICTEGPAFDVKKVMWHA